MKTKKVMQKSEEFNPKDLNFRFELKDCDFKIDALQEKMLQGYLRFDIKFRRAFYTNYTSDFFKFIQDKVKLNEPIHLSVMGAVRGGKSYTMMSVCIFHQACYGRLFDIDYVCANMFEFMEKLKTFPQDKLKDHIFLIDEEKQTVYGVGSTAKKMKMTDVQNIIAINNISTIMINPISWANENAFYGLRAFGRDFKSKISRFMLYNLTGNKSAVTPMGMLYIPIFTIFLSKKYADILEKKYLDKKQKWVNAEQRGEGDVLSEIKRDSARNFIKDKQFLSLKTREEKTVYIGQRLGSEWTISEINEIFAITKLFEKGIDLDK